MIININLTLNNTSSTYDLYSDIDNYVTPIATGLTYAQLTNNYQMVVDDNTTIIRVQSVGFCSNYEDFTISIIPTPTPSPTSVTPTPTPTNGVCQVAALDTSFNAIGTQIPNKIIMLSNGEIVSAGIRVEGLNINTYYLNDWPSFHQINDIAVQSDGKFICVGDWAYTDHNHIIRINSDGSLDTSFISPFPVQGYVGFQVYIESNGNILVKAGPQNHNQYGKLIRLDSSGTIINQLDFSNLEIWGGFLKQSNGKILVYGTGLHLYNEDFTLDTGFTCNLGSGINSIIQLQDGSYICTCEFPNGNPNNDDHFFKINSNGALNQFFQFSGMNSIEGCGHLMTLYLLSNNSYVALGNLTQFNYDFLNGGYIMQFKGNGERYTTFYNSTTGVNKAFNDLTYTGVYKQDTNQFYVGGPFTTYHNTSVEKIVRICLEETVQYPPDPSPTPTPTMTPTITPTMTTTPTPTPSPVVVQMRGKVFVIDSKTTPSVTTIVELYINGSKYVSYSGIDYWQYTSPYSNVSSLIGRTSLTVRRKIQTNTRTLNTSSWTLYVRENGNVVYSNTYTGTNVIPVGSTNWLDQSYSVSIPGGIQNGNVYEIEWRDNLA